MEDIERRQLRDLLQRWQRGEVSEREVHEEAEALWEHYAPLKGHDEDAPQSIAMGVLSNLETLNWQLITPEDIPAMLAFLETPLGQERQGWQAWHRYWQGIDFNQRRQSLRNNPYYAKSPSRSERKREG
jgi:hypothetical protein